MELHHLAGACSSTETYAAFPPQGKGPQFHTCETVSQSAMMRAGRCCATQIIGTGVMRPQGLLADAAFNRSEVVCRTKLKLSSLFASWPSPLHALRKKKSSTCSRRRSYPSRSTPNTNSRSGRGITSAPIIPAAQCQAPFNGGSIPATNAHLDRRSVLC